MVSLRRLSPEDIDEALKLSDAEKWNQTEEDWSFLINSSDNICLAAVEGGKVVGTATAIIYNNKVAWVGMVLVDKNFRGRGISKDLLSALFEKLEHCNSVKLDATPEGRPVYEKFGFREEYKILRMIHPTGQLTDFPTKVMNPAPISDDDLQNIVAYDQIVFGANRKKLIEFLYRENHGNSWMMKAAEQIEGFVLGREGALFYQVGPVSATSNEIGKALIQKSLMELKSKPVVIDVLEDKTELISWLNDLGFIVQRPFYRMFQNENPYTGIVGNQYLICGPEFG
ncbi:GNAT family N-acetyltransferase [Maribellus sediminis]|uniref:GNAT family N-acetyltransferase n=1 Tax=Maribellus sediminis TaxID=2696285 RepID=UPI00142F5AC2|nr:GNAT family N-acetyltransferase [Maribellus sediminis]